MTADEQTTGPVWRDRGTIIANQQARIAELEAEVKRWKNAGPALWEEAERAMLARAEAAEAGLAALRGRIEALADEWEGWARTRSTQRIDAFRDAAAELRAALAVAPAEDTTPAAPHAEDGATGTLAERLAKIEGVSPAVASVRAMMRAELSTAISAPVADPSGDTEGGQA